MSQKCPQTIKFNEFCKSQLKIQSPCPNCYILQTNVKPHLALCKNQKLEKRKFQVLTLDNVTFLCQFGCSGTFVGRLKLYDHWYRSHTYKDLKKWGVNRNLLSEIADEMPKIQTKSTLKVNQDSIDQTKGDSGAFYVSRGKPRS